MHIFQLVKISNANKTFVLLSVTSMCLIRLLEINNSAWPKWDVHVVTSDGKHALLSLANLHYTPRFVVDRKTEGRKCTRNRSDGLPTAQTF